MGVEDAGNIRGLPGGGVPPFMPEGASPSVPVEFPFDWAAQVLPYNDFNAYPLHDEAAGFEEHVLKQADELEGLVDVYAAGMEADAPSLLQTVNKWGNEEISLLYHEYMVAKKVTGGVWSVSEGVDHGVSGVSSSVVHGGQMVEHFKPALDGLADKIEQDIAVVALAYKIPVGLGKIAVLIYKRIFIDRVEDLLKKQPPGMSPEQREEFQAWIHEEKKELAKEAIELAIQFGEHLPSNLILLMNLCKFERPLLQLALTWTGAVLDPLLHCYDLFKAYKKYAKVSSDQAQFKEEIYRRPAPAEYQNLQAVREMAGSLTPHMTAEELMEAATAHKLHADAEAIRNKRREALLEQGAPYVHGFDSMLRSIMFPQPFEVVRTLGGSDFSFAEDIASLDDLSERLGGRSFQSIVADALAFEEVEDAVLYLEAKGIIVAADIDKDTLSEVLINPALANTIDGALAVGLGGKRRYFEERGLAIDPTIGDEATLIQRLQDDRFRENLFVRYIDAHSAQQLTDSTRNALKTLTMKKQKVLREVAIASMSKEGLLLAASVVCSILTVVQATLAATGVLSMPMIALLIPTVGLFVVGAAVMLVAFVAYCYKHPNLFMEYLKGSFVKLAVYNVPRGFHKLRRNIIAVKMLRNSLKMRELNIKRFDCEEDDPRMHKVLEKIEAGSVRAAKLEEKLVKIEGKISFWEEKMRPVVTDIALARWEDFTQRSPKIVKKGSAEEAELIETLKQLRQGLVAGTTPYDDDVRKIAKERLHLDIDKVRNADVEAAILAFAP